MKETKQEKKLPNRRVWLYHPPWAWVGGSGWWEPGGDENTPTNGGSRGKVAAHCHRDSSDVCTLLLKLQSGLSSSGSWEWEIWSCLITSIGKSFTLVNHSVSPPGIKHRYYSDAPLPTSTGGEISPPKSNPTKSRVEAQLLNPKKAQTYAYRV